MSSYRRIQASRANGARSRGPVSIAGKQASARNSLRHGMLAETIVLRGESRERFLASLDALIDELQPTSEIQLDMVESMAVARWRKLRTWAVGTIDLEREMARQQGSAPVRAAIAFRNLSNSGRSLDLVHRYETSYERQFSRTLADLLKLQASQPEPDSTFEPAACGGATWDAESPVDAAPEGEEKARELDGRFLRNEPSPETGHPENQHPEPVDSSESPRPPKTPPLPIRSLPRPVITKTPTPHRNSAPPPTRPTKGPRPKRSIPPERNA